MTTIRFRQLRESIDNAEEEMGGGGMLIYISPILNTISFSQAIWKFEVIHFANLEDFEIRYAYALMFKEHQALRRSACKMSTVPDCTLAESHAATSLAVYRIVSPSNDNKINCISYLYKYAFAFSGWLHQSSRWKMQRTEIT